MTMETGPLLLDEARDSLAATDEDLELGRVPTGYEWVLDHVAAEDKTTAFTTLRLGIKRGTTFIPLEEEDAPEAALLYFSKAPFRLDEGNILAARFTGTTSGDKLHLYANGYWRRKA